MRVVILTSSFPLGPSDGSPAGLFARSFSIALARLGNEVIVVTQERPGVPEKEDEIEVEKLQLILTAIEDECDRHGLTVEFD